MRHGDARADVGAREAVGHDDRPALDLSGLPQWQRDFCAALRRHHGVVLLACATVGVSRPTAYRWRKVNPVFARAWDESLDQGRGTEAGALFHAAVHGEFEPMYDGDEIIGYWKRRSVKAAEEFLKRRGRLAKE